MLRPEIRRHIATGGHEGDEIAVGDVEGFVARRLCFARPRDGTREQIDRVTQAFLPMKKFDLAAEASKKALELSSASSGTPGAPAAAPSASAIFNQGVILWNAGKIPDAKAQFEQAVKLDPNLADARYWLGMALVNAGTPEAMKEAKPHFEAYIKLAPTGANVETAKAIVATIK